MAVLTGDAGNNIITGTNQNDEIRGLAGDDTISGLGGNDDLFGNEGNDVVSGGNGDDNIFGGPGDDNLSGTDGDDRVNGDEGNDRIIGGHGNDALRGGPGNDSFIFSTGDGQDTIWDFSPGQDKIVLAGFQGGFPTTQTSGGNVVLDLSPLEGLPRFTDSITIINQTGINPADIEFSGPPIVAFAMIAPEGTEMPETEAPPPEAMALNSNMMDDFA